MHKILFLVLSYIENFLSGIGDLKRSILLVEYVEDIELCVQKFLREKGVRSNHIVTIHENLNSSNPNIVIWYKKDLIVVEYLIKFLRKFLNK